MTIRSTARGRMGARSVSPMESKRWNVVGWIVLVAVVAVIAAVAVLAYNEIRPRPADATGYGVGDDPNVVFVAISFNQGAEIVPTKILSEDATTVDLGVWVKNPLPWSRDEATTAFGWAWVRLDEPLGDRAVTLFGEPLERVSGAGQPKITNQ